MSMTRRHGQVRLLGCFETSASSAQPGLVVLEYAKCTHLLIPVTKGAGNVFTIKNPARSIIIVISQVMVVLIALLKGLSSNLGQG